MADSKNFLDRRLFGINMGGALDEAKTRIGSMLTPTQPPPSTMTPQGVDAPYTPKYPLEKKSLNALGEKITGIVEDPRNAWIGMGPMAGMAKIAKGASSIRYSDAVTKIRELLSRTDPEGLARMEKALPFDARTPEDLQKDYNFLFRTSKQRIVPDDPGMSGE